MTARTTPDGANLVSADNFARAESDMYFRNVVNGGGFGKFIHIRELTPLDNQLVVRSNRDTLCHLIGSASAWGGNPEKDAVYFGVYPARNDGATV